MRILGIDLGTKSMGLAITDNTQTIVNGISNFEFTRNNYQQCIDEISKILKQYQNEIKQIVLGHPLTLKNTKSE
jgi:putative Holliday junction resolvase